MLHDIYITAWKLGLKTTYYLRTLGASQIEKSTLDAKKFGFTQKREYGFNQEVAVIPSATLKESQETSQQLMHVHLQLIQIVNRVSNNVKQEGLPWQLKVLLTIRWLIQ